MIQAAKEVTLEVLFEIVIIAARTTKSSQVGEGFGNALWLVTRVVTATRRKVKDQVFAHIKTLTISGLCSHQKSRL